MAVPIQDMKVLEMVAPVDNNNTAIALEDIDTLGYDYLTVIVYHGVISADATVCKLRECDTAGGTYADITGCVCGTSTDVIGGATSTLPLAATSDGDIHPLFEVDLRARKRYIGFSLTSGAAASLVCVVGILTRAYQTPTTAAGRGVLELLRG